MITNLIDWRTVATAILLPMISSCLMMGTATGCSTLTKDQVESQSMVMQSWSDFAKENGVMFVGQASYAGRGGLYHQGLYGIDTGLQAQGFFIFDPTRAPPAVGQ